MANDKYEIGAPVHFFKDGDRANTIHTQITGVLKNNEYRVAYVDRPVGLHELEPIVGIGSLAAIVVKIPVNNVDMDVMKKIVEEHDGELLYDKDKTGYYTVSFSNPLNLFWMGMNFQTALEDI